MPKSSYRWRQTPPELAPPPHPPPTAACPPRAPPPPPARHYHPHHHPAAAVIGAGVLSLPFSVSVLGWVGGPVMVSPTLLLLLLHVRSLARVLALQPLNGVR